MGRLTKAAMVLLLGAVPHLTFGDEFAPPTVPLQAPVQAEEICPPVAADVYPFGIVPFEPFLLEGEMAPAGPFVLRERFGAYGEPTLTPATSFPWVAPNAIPAGLDRGIVIYRGQFLLRTEELLPAPNEPNDLFHSQLDPEEERMGMAWSPAASVYATAVPETSKDLWTRIKASPNFGMAYDTGKGDAAFNVSTIKLGKDPGAGQTTFTGGGFQEVPIFLASDTQMRDMGIPGFEASQVQFYVEANNHRLPDELDVEHAYARAYAVENWTFGAGKTYSLYSYSGSAPASLNQSTVLTGTSDLGKQEPIQLRVQRAPQIGGWGGGIGLEDPYDADFDEPLGATVLTRWPTFAGNVRYRGANDADWLQFGGLVRTLGFEDAVGVEHFETAWALSAHGYVATRLQSDSVGGLFVGVAGGEGVGHYVRGVEKSAVFDGGTFSTLEGLGAYIGYKHQWLTPRNHEFGVNVAYGYAMMDTPEFMAATTNRELHHAWANILYFPTKNVAAGFEYQYGERETLAAGEGENHRFLLVVSLSAGGDDKRKAEIGATGYGSRSSYAAPDGQVYEYVPTSRVSRQRL